MSGTRTTTGGRDLVVWGEVLWDFFPDRRLLGGAPANAAYHLACLGENVALASRVGDDEAGREAVRLLAARGVDVSCVQTDAERPTGRVEVTLSADGREPSYHLVPGCAWEHIQVTPTIESWLQRADAVYFGTLGLRTEIPPFTRAMELVPAGSLRVCDINLRPHHVDIALLSVALEYTDVLKLNQDEARILAERAGVTDLRTWLFERMGVKFLCITRGERGSVFFTRDEMVEHPGHAALPGGDNVGAGDAFTAVLIHHLLRERPLAAIADRANRYAAYLASRRGATPDIPPDLIDAVKRAP